MRFPPSIHLGRCLFQGRRHLGYRFQGHRFLGLLMAAAALMTAASCSTDLDASFQSQIVVQGFLYAGEPLDSIIVRQTVPIDSHLADDRARGAAVTISTPDTTYHLYEDTRSAAGGKYLSQTPLIAQPGTTYTLTVTWNGQTATSQTTIPQPVHLDSATLDGRSLSLTATDTIAYPTSVTALQTPGIHLYWSPSPGSAGYGLECVAPLDANDPIVDDLTASLPDSNAFGRYRFFIRSTDEQVVWIQMTYFGDNTLRALALDQNYEDYILGFYLSGSQFNNNTLHVSGGLGIFGSAARASMHIYLK